MSVGKPYQMSSYGENTALRLLSESSLNFTKVANRQLCRIYPAGHRVSSSNYSPIPMWNVGCQLG